MPVPFKGSNLSGEALSDIYTLPFKISFFTVANKNAGTTIVNVSVTDGVDDIHIVPNDLELSEGDMLQGTDKQVMEGGKQIKITSDAAVDFYFTLENITPGE